MDGLNLLNFFMNHESLNIDPKQTRVFGTMNMSDVDLRDQRQDHQLILVWNERICEA
jgi:hypothetical protein